MNRTNTTIERLTIDDFARAFGTTRDRMSDDICQVIESEDFRYQRLEGAEKEETLTQIADDIESGKFAKVGPQRQDIWERCWQSQLDKFSEGNYSLDSLVPDFIKPNRTLRFDGELIRPLDAKFELNFFRVFRQWMFQTYVPPFEAVYEFGCGSGFNMAYLAQQYPQKKIYGLDWSESSVALVNQFAKVHKLDNLEGRRFNFFDPDRSLKVERNSLFLTMAALEQIGDRFESFLTFILEKQPALCVHMEPILEFYNPNNPVDASAIEYHTRRNYLNQYLPRLQQFEKEGKLKIHKAKRTGFGSLYHEGYSSVVWEPVG